MDYKNKVCIKKQNGFGEITAVFPGDQGIRLETNGEKHYRINYEGNDIILGETAFHLIFSPYEPKKEGPMEEIKQIIGGVKNGRKKATAKS